MVEQVRPDLVINAAAYTAVDQAEQEEELATRINGEAAGEGANAAASVGATFVQISTDYVFDGTAEAPIAEGQKVAPLGAYGRSKLAGEEAVRTSGADFLILRTSWVISPFGRNFLRTVLSAVRERDELRVVSDQRGSPTNALDLADAILALARELAHGRTGIAGRTFHVTNSGDASWLELAETILAAAARHGLPSARVRPIATSDWPTPAPRPAYSVLDNRAFTEATGQTLRPWRDAVDDLVALIARTT
jgi:dTDP-4-dehydrorhamnose reductase